MDKEKFIKSLPRVKLVLGNGFDLHCGLHTRYEDYFDIYYCEKYLLLKKLFEKYKSGEKIDFANDIESKYKVNVWDLFMVVNSQAVTTERRWCNVESIMTDSFKNPNLPENNKLLPSAIFWKELVKKTAVPLYNSEEANFIKEFIKIKNDTVKTNKDFYDFLLQELKEFEYNFGDFIRTQVIYVDYTRNTYINNKYLNNAMFVIEQLCDKAKLSTIDTFNYTDLPDGFLSVPFHHINGSCAKPIFGIDSIFDPSSQEFAFTKTSRRMDNDILDDTYDKEKPFENIVIFGHSLNEPDYNYFFPLFDKIGLLDYSRTSVVAFAYNEYEKQHTNINKRLFDLLYAYAKDKGNERPERFLDSLTTQRRVLTLKIQDIKNDNSYLSVFDDRWNTMTEEAKKYKLIFNNEAKESL